MTTKELREVVDKSKEPYHAGDLYRVMLAEKRRRDLLNKLSKERLIRIIQHLSELKFGEADE